MKIVFIHKNKIQIRPPVISSLLTLSDLGHELTLITTGINEFWEKELTRRNIKYYVVDDNKIRVPYLSAVSKFLNYKNFGKECFRIARNVIHEKKDGLLWVESAYTMVALADHLKAFNYVLQIQELHENSKMQQRFISSLIHDAKAVFMPEYNRTALFKAWYKLKSFPIVLPNKPYFLLGNEEADKVINEHKDILHRLDGKKIILYQGGIYKERMLDRICKAIKQLNSHYHLLLVGPEQSSGYIQELRGITEEITHVCFMPVPYHLAFCKIAHIGFVFYSPDCLNNLYCAPNKIFEYSAYGLPMLGNDIPGLRYTIGTSHAGVTVNPESVDQIARGIMEIEKNYNDYVENAKRFYLSIDNKKTISDAVNSLEL